MKLLALFAPAPVAGSPAAPPASSEPGDGDEPLRWVRSEQGGWVQATSYAYGDGRRGQLRAHQKGGVDGLQEAIAGLQVAVEADARERTRRAHDREIGEDVTAPARNWWMKVKTPKPPPKRPAPNESAAPAEKRRGPRRGLREPIRPARAPRRGAPRQAAARGSRRLSDDFSVVGVHAADSPLVKVVLAYVDVDDFEDSSPLAAARYLVRPGGPPVPEHVAAACRVLIGGSNSAAKRAAKRVLESAAEGEESLADAARRLADGGELDALETTACAWAAENPLVASAALSTATLERRRAGEVQAARAAAVKEKPPYQTQTRSDRFQASFKWTSDPRLESRMICVGTWDTPEEAATAVHCALLRIEEPDKYANLLKHPCVAKLNLSETTTHSEKVHRIVDKAFTKRRKEDAKAIAALAAQSAGAAPSAQDKPPECDSKRKCLSLIQKCEPVFNRKRKGDASSLPQDYCVLCAARNAANKSASTARRNKHKARA